MARKQIKEKELVVENPIADTVVDTVEVVDVEATSASVVNGSFTARTYTKEIHGDNFMELAKEFVSHAGGEIVVR